MSAWESVDTGSAWRETEHSERRLLLVIPIILHVEHSHRAEFGRDDRILWSNPHRDDSYGL